MAGKSPSGLEMVLKGLDNQLEIATLDSLGMERFLVFMKIGDKQKKSRISETVLQGIIPNVFP
jgi:hypothetical protein